MKNDRLFYFLCLLVTAISCDRVKSDEEIDARTFQQMMTNSGNVVVLDVRTPEEFESGHLDDAVNINYHDEFDRAVDTLDIRKTYLIYCKGGGRSAKAGDLLREKGFAKVYELKGGIDAWNKQDLPLESR